MNATFLAEHLVSDGRVRRSWRQGKVLAVGFLEDHAAVALAFLDLFSLTGDVTWLKQTRAITAHLVNVFRDRHHFNRAGIQGRAMNPRVCEALACGALATSEPRDDLVGLRVGVLDQLVLEGRAPQCDPRRNRGAVEEDDPVHG